MPKGVSQGMRFQITKDRISCTWVVYRVGGDQDQHCHMKKIGACRRLIKILKQGDYPYSPWMRESARRLLDEEEYAKLKKPKDRYINRR